MICCTASFHKTNLSRIKNFGFFYKCYNAVIQNQGKEFAKANTYSYSSIIRRLHSVPRLKKRYNEAITHDLG